MNREIILKSNQISDFVATLPLSGPFGEEIFANDNKSTILSRIVTAESASPKAEMHEKYNDIFIIREGREELFVGGEIIDKEETSPGEWRGNGLSNAKKYFIETGDVVIIPKNIPHQHGIGVIKMAVIKTS